MLFGIERAIMEGNMGGGCSCPIHKVSFENQNYCELCKLDDMRCPYCKCPGGSHYCECVVFSQNKQEQKPMTREEALKIQANCFTTVQLLEALGLLKFDEAPKKQVEWVNGIGSRCWFSEGYDPNKSEWTRVDSEWTRVESVTPESIVEFNFKASGVDNPKLRTKEVIGHLARCGYKIVRNSS